MGHYFRNEIVAQAKALALEGWSTRKAEAELKRLFPGEDTPARTTLIEWRRELAEADHEELESNELRIARRADELVQAKLSAVEDHLEKVRLPELVMTAGVYRDKAFKRRELKKPTLPAHTGPLVVIVGVEKPRGPEVTGSEVIEGEAKEVTKDDGQALVPR